MIHTAPAPNDPCAQGPQPGLPLEFDRTGQEHLMGELLRRRLCGRCDQFPEKAWRNAVHMEQTDSGYWTWVAERALADGILEQLLHLSGEAPRAAAAAMRERRQ